VLVFKEWLADKTYNLVMGRSLGRVICEKDGLEDCTGHIAALVPNETFAWVGIRWVDPADVVEVRVCPVKIPARFFATWDSRMSNDAAQDIIREIDKGMWMEQNL